FLIPRTTYLSPFLLVLPRPPCSTLFPYTTLFRSRSCRAPSLHQESSGARRDRTCRSRSRRSRAARARPENLRRRNTPCDRRRASDRKSTRLNSSHGSISYAVFCLKKKKKQYYAIE